MESCLLCFFLLAMMLCALDRSTRSALAFGEITNDNEDDPVRSLRRGAAPELLARDEPFVINSFESEIT